jgi:hypothetical protein
MWLTIPRFTKSPVVTIQAGEGESVETWFVHRELLCSKSDFFKKCFESGMTEAVENKVVLKEDDPKVVAWFVNWLYTGKVQTDDTDSDPTLDALYPLYFFADKIGSDDLHNETIDLVTYKSAITNSFPCKVIPEWCNKGHGESELVVWAIDEWAHNMTNAPQSWRKGDISAAQNIIKSRSAEPLLVNKLLLAVWKYNQNKDLKEAPSEVRGCHYHRHKEGAKCSKAS